MNEMVERLAAVLREKLDYSGNHGDKAFKEAAEAVLSALREPTKPMILAGAEGVKHPLGPPREDGTPRAMALIYPLEGYAAAAAFRRMIDEALR